MDKLHLWTVWLLVSAEGCLDPCQGKLKDGSQLDHVNNQVASASNTGPWTWQGHKPSPYLPGGSSMEIEGLQGKGSGRLQRKHRLGFKFNPFVV